MGKKRTKKLRTRRAPKCPHCGARLDKVTVVHGCADYYFWNEEGYYEFGDSDPRGGITFLCPECEGDITDCDLPGLDPESLDA